jgi:hypothetical protein
MNGNKGLLFLFHIYEKDPDSKKLINSLENYRIDVNNIFVICLNYKDNINGMNLDVEIL